jgi:lauroyl/myristoyl acyltransferase
MKSLQYLFISLSHKILKHLPYTTIRILSVPIGTLYFLLTFRSSIKLFKRKEIFNELKINYKPLIVKINYTRYWLETLWLTNKNFSKYISPHVEIENLEYVQKLKKQYPGLIFALPHLGNWEFAIPIGNSIKLNLLAVAEPLRESLGIEIIIGGKGQNTFDLLVNKLKSGKDICLLSERSIKKSGVATEFFGQLAAFPKGPVALSLKTEVPIIPTAMIKTKRGYKLRFNKPFYVPYFENEATSIQHGLKTLSKSFEELLALDINDWHSIQPVWTSEY